MKPFKRDKMKKLVCALAFPFALAALPAGTAFADHGGHGGEGHGPKFSKFPPLFGSYQAQGLVLTASSTNPAAPCPSAVGTTYSGVLLLSKGKTLTIREAVNLAAGASIFEQQFVGSGDWTSTNNNATFTNSGTYNYGTVGLTSSTGTFTATLTVADQVSFILNASMSYTVGTAPNTGTCTETDQITLLGTSSSGF
jgi:hypothetical protein